MKKLVALALFSVLALVPTSGYALPLAGTVTLSQSLAVCPGADCVLAVTGAGTVTGLDTAVALDFTSTGTPTPNVAGPMSIDGGTGDFTGIIGTGTIKDFCFTTSACGIYPTAPIGAWQLSSTGASFDMSSVIIKFQDATGLVLNGTGVFHVAGFDATPGIWSLAVSKTSTALSFSATDAATAVPEPASLLLMGTGLLFGGNRLRRKRS